MINEFNQAITDKTKDQYKIIEDKYLTLKRYLILFTKKHKLISKEDIELILEALDGWQEEDMEEESNE